MNHFLYALPTKGTLRATAGPYDGEFDIDQIIFDAWDGRGARHFVPVDYYSDLLLDNDGVFKDTYKEYKYFVFLENNDEKDVYSILIDNENYLLGQWITCLWDDKLTGFPEAYHAQAFFYWLTSEETQEIIYGRQRATNTQCRFAPSTPLI